MTIPPNPETGKPKGIFETVKLGKEIVEVIGWVITSGIALVSFVKAQGGLVPFLLEVAFYGFACYAAVFVILPVGIFALAGLDKAFGRVTSDTAAGLVAGLSVLAGGALIRWGVFAPGITEDLDTIGTIFGVLMGAGFILIPFVLLWYFHGSKPDKK